MFGSGAVLYRNTPGQFLFYRTIALADLPLRYIALSCHFPR